MLLKKWDITKKIIVFLLKLYKYRQEPPDPLFNKTMEMPTGLGLAIRRKIKERKKYNESYFRNLKEAHVAYFET